jgi:hypothetical protein
LHNRGRELARQSTNDPEFIKGRLLSWIGATRSVNLSA